MAGFRENTRLGLVTLLALQAVLRTPQADGLSFLFHSGMGEGSHFLTSAIIAEALVEKGHNVTFLLCDAWEYQTRNPRWKFAFEMYSLSIPRDEMLGFFHAYMESAVQDGPARATMRHFSNIMRNSMQFCDEFLDDESLIRRLDLADFDALVADVSWTCGILLAAKINITRVTVNPSGYLAVVSEQLGADVNLAYTPTMMENVPRLPMTYVQRLWNVLVFNLQKLITGTSVSSLYRPLQIKYNISPERSFMELFSDAELVLYNMDFAVEDAVPLTPNIVPVGGLTTRPAKPLTKDLEAFISGCEGLVVFCLGSYVNHTNKQISRTIMDGLGQIPFCTIWKYDNQDHLPVPDNVKLMDWLPLNDLLGHNKTKAFVYQGGNNGFYEALYHAVPMLVMPVLGDQGQVASRVVNNDLGAMLDMRVMSSDELRDAVMEITSSKRIQSEIRRLSEIYRDKPMTPLEKAVYWIEHVAKFGGKSYRPGSLDLGFIQWNMVEVYATLTVLALMIVFITYKVTAYVCGCLVSCIIGRSKVADEKKNK